MQRTFKPVKKNKKNKAVRRKPYKTPKWAQNCLWQRPGGYHNDKRRSYDTAAMVADIDYATKGD